MTVAVFTFVLLLGNVLKEILTLLVNRQASFSLVVEAVGLLIPFVWVFALPMGMLTATLLIFGRFSADQELTAVRASGVSLLTLITPVLLLSLVLCGFSALVNMEIGPRCRVAYTKLLSNLRIELSSAQLPEGRIIRDFKNYLFYVGKNRRGDLQDVTVFMLKDETNLLATVRAPRGKLAIDTESKTVTLRLFDAKTVAANRVGGGEEFTIQMDLQPAKRGLRKPKLSDLSFSELRNEIRDLERRVNLPITLAGSSPRKLGCAKRSCCVSGRR